MDQKRRVKLDKHRSRLVIFGFVHVVMGVGVGVFLLLVAFNIRPEWVGGCFGCMGLLMLKWSYGDLKVLMKFIDALKENQKLRDEAERLRDKLKSNE